MPPIAEFAVVATTPHDHAWVRQLMIDHWGAELVVTRGQIYYPHLFPGFVALAGTERIGLITYRIDGTECEVLSLNSLRPGMGVGGALLSMVVQVASQHGCRRVWLITTNDNLAALGFYQKRGFVLAALHRNALAETRRIKPTIPLIGMAGIPLRDELELECILAHPQ
jgi:DNA-3-methyladenine glycosylase I